MKSIPWTNKGVITQRLGKWLGSRGSVGRHILGLSAVLAISITLMLGIGSYLLTYSHLRQQIAGQLDYSSRMLAQRIDFEFHSAHDEAAELSRRSLLANALSDSQGANAYVYPFLREYEQARPDVLLLGIYDANGDAVSMSGKIDTSDLSVLDMRKRVNEGRAFSMIEPVGKDGLHLIMGFPVTYLPTGMVEGMMVMEVDLAAQMRRAFQSLPADFGARLNLHDRPVYRAGTVQESRLNRALTLDSYLGSLGLGVTVLLDESALERPLLRLAVLHLLVLCLVILCALALARRASRHIVEPLDALADAAQEVVQSSVQRFQEVHVGGSREVQHLAAAFNRMVKQLRGQQNDLEARVAARTEALASAERRLSDILASMRDVVYSATLDMKQFLYLSPAARTMFGVLPDSLVAELSASPKAWLCLMPEADRLAMSELMSQLGPDSAGEARYRIVRADGEVRWHANRYHVVLDAAGQPLHVAGIVSDITERVRADQAREQAEAELLLRDRALASTHNGVVIADISSPDQPIIFVNPAFEAMTGYQASEVLGRNCSMLQGPGTDSFAIEELRQAIKDGRECTVTLKNYRKDGSSFWNQLSISPVSGADGVVRHFVGVQNDMSELVQRDETIRDWAYRQEVIFTLTPDGFATFDRHGRLEYANPGFERMTGMLVGDLQGLELAELQRRLGAQLDRNSPEANLCDWVAWHRDQSLADNLFGSDPLVLPVLRISRPSLREVQPSIFYTDSETTCIVLHLRDITREREVDRMKSEFLSTAAHELRTPMASIMGFSELLLSRQFPPDMARDMLETILRQSRRLTNLLNELLDLARIEARRGQDFKQQRLSLASWVGDAVKAVCVDDYAARIEIGTLADAQVIGDAAKLQQALLNVISNALKYSPNGGVATVSAEVVGGRVAVRVVDQGIGMSSEHLARVFERFFRADPSGNIPGTGLGMSLVKEIIELHFGEVQISSEVGQGTCVTLWLKVAPAELAPVEQELAA
ncbi:PAS domain-containing protein [Chitinimonas sp.]|uniref:PAS domain-containing protein n=1 Tax=Chitinimonas sp. TaxID=1934313 RepID=UPI0035B02DE4